MTYQSAAPAAPLSESDDRLWGSLANFGNILGFLPSLLIYLILKDRGAVVRRDARTALNWIIVVFAAAIVLEIVQLILSGISYALPSGVDVVFTVLSVLVGLVFWAVLVVNLIFSIINGIRVNQGGVARYPFSLNLVK